MRAEQGKRCHGRGRRSEARQGKARQGKAAWHGTEAWHVTAGADGARQGKARQGKAAWMSRTNRQTHSCAFKSLPGALAAHVRADRFIECAWRSRCACVRSHRCLVLSLRVCVRADRFIE